MQMPIITITEDTVTIYGAALAFSRRSDGLMVRVWYKNKSQIYTSSGNQSTAYFETLCFHAALHRKEHDSI